MSAQKQKFEPALQEVADKILHELPEELAMCISFKPHESNDALVLSYPANLHGTPEMHLLDSVVCRYHGGYVSRGKETSYYLVPRPKPQQQSVAEKSKEEPKTAVPVKAPKPEPIIEKPAPQAAPVQKSNSQPQPKQPSPVQIFIRDNCSSCADASKCDIQTDAGRFQFAACLQLLEMQQRGAIVSALQKLADRAIYSRSSSQHRERHVDGGITWFWNEAKTYEKALDVENKDSQDFASLKKMLVDAASAGKKGLVVDGYWCFLDSFKKDGVLRKKAQVFPRAGGA